MNPNWLSYLPHHVIEDIIKNPNQSAVGREQRFEAVALFADVSGFTAISEALGKAGRGGTEELTSILNSYFRPMIDLIQSYGGIIGKFGGDAMTVLFPYSGSTRTSTVRRAIQCAVEMQANMHQYEAIPTSAGTFGLAMKAGLAMGTTLATNVGDLDVRLEYLIAGNLLDLCADAEHHATKGEVVIHNDLLQYAGELEIVETREQYTCIAALKTPVDKAPLKALDAIPDSLHTRFSIFLHPIIVERMQSGQEQFINEHRKVTVLFVSFSGFDYDHDPDVVVKLQDYLSQVIRIVSRYDGYLNKVDMGDKGSKYIVLFGAPLAHENDEERALLCALDLSRIVDVPAKIGINTGFVFSGQVGSPVRQEYTVMGDTVNLSARLMQAAAPGQIMVSEATRRMPKMPFTWEEQAPIMVKGKTEPIAIALLKDIQKTSTMEIRRVSYQTPMIGRLTELAVAQEKCELALTGQGQFLGITAEAGLGKSRLATEITAWAELRGFSAFSGECLSYGTNISYLVWENIWRDLLYVDPLAPLSTQISQLTDLLNSIDPSFVQRISLLGLVLNIAVPPDPTIDGLDGSVKQELLDSLLLDCLKWRSAQSPLLLVLEDTHWIDPLSAELLEYLGRNIRDLPVVIVNVYRPPTDVTPESTPLKRFPHFTELELTEFDETEARRLIEYKLEQLFGGIRHMPDALVERIVERAQGNPFYIEELMNFIHDQEVNVLDATAVNELQLPDSLHSLIVSRIDRLNEQEKLTLKVASVLGRLFRAHWLWGSYPELGHEAHVKEQLTRLQKVDLTLRDKPEPELEYLFKHILTQEVTYESLAIATRETLHERVGQFIERAYSENLDPFINMLAHHYGHSRDAEKQRLYFRRAGDLAKRAYANDAAVSYYRKLLPLLPDTEQGDVLRHLGEVLQLMGEWDEAERCYRLGLEKSPSDSSAYAWCLTDLGHLLASKESPVSAEEWLRRAVTQFETINDLQGLTRALKYSAIAYMEQGKYDDALAYAQRQLDIANRNQDRISVSEASLNIAWVYRDQGELETSLRYLQDSLKISQEHHYQYGIVAATGDMAAVYFFQGNYFEAVQSCVRALDAAHEIGFLQGISLISSNMGEIYRKEEDLDSALLCHTHSLQIASQLGDWMQIYFALGNITSVYVDLNRLDELDRLFPPVVALARDLNVPFSLCELLYFYARLDLKRQRYDEAVQKLDEAVKIAEEVGQHEVQFRATLLREQVALMSGRIEKAELVTRLKALLPNWEEPAEKAALHYEIWLLDSQQNESREVASKLYSELYKASPNMHNYKRYHVLSMNNFAAPPALPPLPAYMTDRAFSPEVLIERALAQIEKRLAD